MTENESSRPLSLDQIPEDPLAIPPPYWRSTGAIFQIQDALEDITTLLYDIISVNNETNIELEDYYEKFPYEEDHPELEKFGDIVDDLIMLEHKIKIKAELVIFMSAIQSEDKINKFCVYNLHKDIAESIEKLSPPEKLLIASASVGVKDIKGKAVFDSISKLSSWRNAYAHGHCVDRPVKSLRHNHLIPPTEYPNVPNSIINMKEMVERFINVDEYLREISLNSYTSGISGEVEDIKDLLGEISRYHFHVSDKSKEIYSVERI